VKVKLELAESVFRCDSMGSRVEIFAVLDMNTSAQVAVFIFALASAVGVGCPA